MKRTSSRLLKIICFSLVLAVTGSTGCVSLERSVKSGYAHTFDDNSYVGPGRRAREVSSVRQELYSEGLWANGDSVSLRLALKRAEQELVARKEREQYFVNKPYMRNDRERLEFLSLPTYEDRERWLQERGIGPDSDNFPPYVKALIEVNDIAIGFTKKAVRASWGEPELIEVAGNPIYGNERWHYSDYSSSPDGYRSLKRIVYFESGVVVGWESR